MPGKLKIGVVQFSQEVTLAQNRDKFVHLIGEAGAKGCRVVVFPEGALRPPLDTAKAEIDAAIRAVCEAAARSSVYVVMGLLYRLADAEPLDDSLLAVGPGGGPPALPTPHTWPLHNRLLVVGPDGLIVHSYDKLWGDPRFPNVPGPFEIDGIPCCAAICADRWIRGVEELPVFAGAQILFECSNNFEVEWVPDLGWYWPVPRALRNGVYVVFANTPRVRPGFLFMGENLPGHGHTAVIAPDGRVVAALGDEADEILVATLDLAQATRAEAIRRHSHPLFRRFWDVGLQIMSGAEVEAPPFEPLASPQVSLTLAAAQMAGQGGMAANLARMERLIGEAQAAGADVVAFPELAVTGAGEADVLAASPAALEEALGAVQAMAGRAGLYVAFGMPYTPEGGRRHNAAFVVSSEGALLTRYDQLVVDRPGLFAPGRSTRSMWFDVRGVPAVVTLGRDALWSELAELAAVRGAQLHLHLAYHEDAIPDGRGEALGDSCALDDPARPSSKASPVLRRQLWANLASYYTFTATVNAAAPAGGQSAIWHDFRPSTNHRREIDGRVSFCAVRVAQAGAEEGIICARQRIPAQNLHFRAMVERTNPQMRAWYIAGAEAIYR